MWHLLSPAKRQRLVAALTAQVDFIKERVREMLDTIGLSPSTTFEEARAMTDDLDAIARRAPGWGSTEGGIRQYKEQHRLLIENFGSIDGIEESLRRAGSIEDSLRVHGN